MVRARISNWLRTVLSAETRTGVITIAVAIVAVAWVNSPLVSSYDALLHAKFGFPGLILDVHAWAADFLLAFFFFVIGIELRHEFTVGSLNSPRKALVPVAAAIGGMVLPALIYVAFNAGQSTVVGWGIPMATDIAFALAVLALVAPKSNPALRVFLLALAVVDDLGAILVIALFYTPSLQPLYLGGAALALGLFAVLQRTRLGHPLILVPLGLGIWWLVFQSGVHATIAGVAVGLLLATRASPRKRSLADRALAVFLPVSSYVAVPLFVLVSAGVDLAVIGASATTSPVFAGIVVGLLVGKPLGIVLFVWIAERVFGGRRDPSLSGGDIWLIGTISSIGFTVALLINELALGDSSSGAVGTASVVVASVIGALAAFVVAKRVAS
jgi:NhaA family Na+:H+ antiporter